VNPEPQSGDEPGVQLRGEVAEAANVLAGLGLVTAYGHVSARSGESMLITPAADLAGVTAAGVVEVPLAAVSRPGGTLPAGAPAEAWAHLALYRARPDAAAIARAQPASAFAVAATVTIMVPLHGQAAWLGESVPVHDEAALLRSPGQAERAAASLPAGEALLLRGNGALTLGASPGVAVARMWLLAAACDVYLAALAAAGAVLVPPLPLPGGPIPPDPPWEGRISPGPPREGTTPPSLPGVRTVLPLSAGEIASWRAVGGELLPRLWQHLRRRSGAGADAGEEQG
jgi:HCOMODA/2-hydroxy-3-carboxy-muconic semialdehyde decarboxylase